MISPLFLSLTGSTASLELSMLKISSRSVSMSQPSRMPSRSRISWKSILLFLSILGPGIITANVGNDASGITTYSLAGAHFGYGFIWLLIPLTIALVFIQEMAARMGARSEEHTSELQS